MENYVGKRIDGRYEIQDVVGVGGMAVVYKAYDNIDDRIVAVKILKDEYLANEEFRRRFKNESKAIAVLNHRNIVKVFDVSFGDRLQYIVMEYIEGISLKEYIEQRGVIDWNEALFFSIQVLRALQHAHDKGIVHRDVKPQNIMLLENGTIKVTDFGIARFSHGETRTMTEKAIGSVHYISPEQAKGELTDEKADIYSVGIVLYEMLTGRLPFEAENAVSVALMQVNNEAVLPRTINSKIPLGFEQITMKAMQKNTRERYQTAAEMLLDLEEFKRNPNIKFDYDKYFVDEQPTRYVGKIQDNSSRVTPSKRDVQERKRTVPPASQNRRREPAPTRTTVAVAENNERDNSGSRKFAVVAGVFVAVLVFVVALIGLQLKNGSLTLGVGKKIEVENFMGMNYENEILNNPTYNEKYNFEVSYESFTDGKDGCVFKQDPKSGSQIAKGATIRLYVAKSGEGQVIPDFYGQNYQSVCNTLESMGFVVKVIPDATSNETLGCVVRTDPASGSSVVAGSNINVYYAAATETGTLFKMPNLTGLDISEAEDIIRENGLILSSTDVIDTPTEKDTVVEQSPKDGSPVQKGDGVILTISSGNTLLEKEIALPSNVGTLSLKVVKGDEVILTEDVNTATQSVYNLKIPGNKLSRVKVYLNDKVYFEAKADFTKDPVKLSDEKYHAINFYVDVVGMDVSQAKTALKKAGYKNIIVEEKASSEKKDTVLKQSPSQSSAPNLDKTATIVLTVAKGKKPDNNKVTTTDVFMPGINDNRDETVNQTTEQSQLQSDTSNQNQSTTQDQTSQSQSELDIQDGGGIMLATTDAFYDTSDESQEQ